MFVFVVFPNRLFVLESISPSVVATASSVLAINKFFILIITGVIILKNNNSLYKRAYAHAVQHGKKLFRES